jgi:FG-GAP-like repeat
LERRRGLVDEHGPASADDVTISAFGLHTVTISNNAFALDTALFLGSISGPLSVDIAGITLLGGVEDYTGNTTFEGTASLTNSGTYDLVANEDINGASSTSGFANNALFEKTDGGVSDVTSNFLDNGTLNVLSGSIVFSGGFTDNGVIHGLVTRSKLVPIGESPEVIVSALVASDFNGDARSDILWQNADGQASIWDTSGNTLSGGGGVSPNPGSSWKAIGTGDFNGDGFSDILFQNTSGKPRAGR